MSGKGIDRRTLLQGVAWTAPVLTVTAAIPRAAASSLPSIVPSLQEVDADLYLLIVSTFSDPGVPVGDVPLTIEQNLGTDGATDWQMYDYITTSSSGSIAYRYLHGVPENYWRVTGWVAGQYLIAPIEL